MKRVLLVLNLPLTKFLSFLNSFLLISSHILYLLVACIFLSLATFARKKDDGMMFYGNLLFSSLCFQVTE